VAALVLGVVAVPRLLGRDDGPRASVRLPPGTPVFAADELTWAQDSTIHYGERRYDVSPWLVRSMLRTDYGLLLEGARRRGPYAPTRTLWYDGTTLTELPGRSIRRRSRPTAATSAGSTCAAPTWVTAASARPWWSTCAAAPSWSAATAG
jgi:hypothetical protein